jgi:serine/threonine protein kinase
MNETYSDSIEVREGRLFLNQKPLEKFRIIKKIGAGASGIVLLAENTILNRKEAIKVWLKLRPNDSRNKILQGLVEAQKIVAAASPFVAQVYDADIVDSIFFMTMEYVEGTTLKEYLNQNLTTNKKWWLARLYINAIEKINDAGIIHGDPHWGNVMVYQHIFNKYEQSTGVKLLDFGTSYFTDHEFLEERHWRTVEETFVRITHTFSSYESVKQFIDQLRRERASKNDDIKHLRIAFYDDFLDGLKLEAGVHL